VSICPVGTAATAAVSSVARIGAAILNAPRHVGAILARLRERPVLRDRVFQGIAVKDAAGRARCRPRGSKHEVQEARFSAERLVDGERLVDLIRGTPDRSRWSAEMDVAAKLIRVWWYLHRPEPGGVSKNAFTSRE
jgi:hypothetical protein